MPNFFSSDGRNDTMSPFHDFGQSNPEALNQIKKCNILVVGNTGAGKSTLISTILKIPVSTTVTESISKTPYINPAIPIALYDTPGLEKKDKKNKEIRGTIDNFIKEQIKKKPEEHIHVIWYCLNSEVCRNSEVDKAWISSLNEKLGLPVILVITKSILDEKTDFHKQLERDTGTRAIVVLAQPKNTNSGTVNSYGINNLKRETENFLNKAADKAIADSVNNLATKALAWCRDGCGKLFGFQLIPFIKMPFVKQSGSSLLQIWMISNISKAFGYNFDKALMEKLCLAGTVAYGFDSLIEELFKNLPINLDNIQSIKDVLDTFKNALEQADVVIPFKDELLEMVGSFAESSFGTVPVVTGFTAIATTFSTWILGYALINALKDYKTAEYRGELLPNLETLLQHHIQEIVTSIQQLLNNPLNPGYSS